MQINLNDVLKDYVDIREIEINKKKIKFGVKPITEQYILAQIEVAEQICDELEISEDELKIIQERRQKYYSALDAVMKAVQEKMEAIKSGDKKNVTEDDLSDLELEDLKIKEEKFGVLMNQKNRGIVLKFLVVDPENFTKPFLTGDLTSYPKDFITAISNEAFEVIKSQRELSENAAKKLHGFPSVTNGGSSEKPSENTGSKSTQDENQK